MYKIVFLNLTLGHSIRFLFNFTLTKGANTMKITSFYELFVSRQECECDTQMDYNGFGTSFTLYVTYILYQNKNVFFKKNSILTFK